MRNTALIIGDMQQALDLSGQDRQEEDILPEHAEWPYHDEEWHLELILPEHAEWPYHDEEWHLEL